MVKIMRLRSLNGNSFINKPQRDSAPKLHKLFNNNAPFEIPTAREKKKKKVTWYKWFSIEHADIVGGIDAESQELCDLINVDWNDLDVSVIDEFLNHKQERCMNGDRLTFKDFKLKS